jgi:membrane fusion protein, copper/silver efflux system
MNRPWFILIILIVGITVGVYIERRFEVISKTDSIVHLSEIFQLSSTSEATSRITKDAGSIEEREILYWVSPMDPNDRRDKPSKDWMGMDFIPVYADKLDMEDKSIVRISPEVVNNLGVRIAKVQTGKFSKRIDTVGYVDFDESKISHVHLRTEGWIHNLVVNIEGERVNKGQLLFTLYSPTLVNAQEEYLQAVASAGQALIQASAQRLLSLGLTESQIDNLQKTRKASQFVATYAPQAGIVSALNVRHGMYVKPETEVMALANLDSIWLQAEVFERQSTWVRVGQPAEARLPSMPGRVWKGLVDYVYPELDPVTRTLRVRLRFDNPEEFLKPNMYADVSILGAETESVLHIPREALILDGKVPRVILALGDGRFRPKTVTPGIESGDRVEIIDGLGKEDVVVVSAQFLIDSEASLNASFQRMEPVMNKTGMEEHVHPFGEGIVNAINKTDRTINLNHDPIKLLNWPAMTMDFAVAKHINLDAIQPKSHIKFYLAKDNTGEYFISNITLLQTEDQVHD